MQEDLVWPACQPNSVKAAIVQVLQARHQNNERFEISCPAQRDKVVKQAIELCVQWGVKHKVPAVKSTLHNVHREVVLLNPRRTFRPFLDVPPTRVAAA